MNSDVAFNIGSTHDVCQDYALTLSGSIVLSDGCSSSPLTDFGSRLLCATSLNQISSIAKEIYPKDCILSAYPSAKLLNLPKECMDATLLVATPFWSETFMFGDGVIVLKAKDGTINVIEVDFYNEKNQSLPFYINYLIDSTRFQRWLKDVVKKTTLTFCKFSQDKDAEILLKKEYINKLSETPNLDMSSNNIHVFGETGSTIIKYGEDIEWITLFSDGIKTFYTTTEIGEKIQIPLIDVLKRILNFKNFNGKFVQRRINRFLENCAKDGWSHADDLSMATLYLGE